LYIYVGEVRNGTKFRPFTLHMKRMTNQKVSKITENLV
jgi:hypothetical protein